MSLSSHNLDAFLTVARTLSFSKAAEQLHVTQSALSQRIQKLESELESSLFIRDRAGLRLTELAEKLLRYCQVRETLEIEFLKEITTQKKDELAGILRIASYSSVLRSVVLPALSPFLRKNPDIQCEFFSREISELPGLLQRGEADFIITDSPVSREDLVSKTLGHEEYVVIESSKHSSPPNIYLDHDAQDTATSEFFKKQKGKRPAYRRSYLDDVYGILDGVALGLGRAVMSRHLLEKNFPVSVLSDFQPRRVEVVLQYYAQPYYSKLQERVVNELSLHCKRFLGSV
jgi:DNA-binding transcriptional LysR family regulator